MAEASQAKKNPKQASARVLIRGLGSVFGLLSVEGLVNLTAISAFSRRSKLRGGGGVVGGPQGDNIERYSGAPASLGYVLAILACYI